MATNRDIERIIRDLETGDKITSTLLDGTTTFLSKYFTALQRRLDRNYKDPTIRNAVFADALQNLLDTMFISLETGCEIKERFYENEVNELEEILNNPDNELDQATYNKVDKLVKSYRSKAVASTVIKSVQNTAEILSTLFSALQLHIQTPIYNPDHVYGNALMEGSKNHTKSLRGDDKNNNN